VSEYGEFVAGAEATGTWSYKDKRGRDRSKTVVATSATDGMVEIRTRLRNVTNLRFCIDDIVKPGYVFQPIGSLCSETIFSAGLPPQ
jgi:hypothetical protein